MYVHYEMPERMETHIIHMFSLSRALYMYIYIYTQVCIYIYIYMQKCVCVCVCGCVRERVREREREREERERDSSPALLREHGPAAELAETHEEDEVVLAPAVYLIYLIYTTHNV